jgi:Flp pilus assembly protein TadG
LVEFLLVLPFLLLVFGGIIDFSRVYHEFMLANEAVRDGVRCAAAGEDFTAVQAAVQTYDKRFAADVSAPSSAPGQSVTVTVTGSVRILTPILRSFFSPNPYPVKAAATMQIQ